MDQQKMMVKQMIDLQRVAFNGMLNNMITFWDQTEKMLNAYTDQVVWLPEEGRKSFREWTESGRKGCENIRNTVDDGYNRLERCFSST